MKKLLYVSLLLAPFVSSAEATDLKSLVSDLVELVNLIIPLLFGFALVAFMWGVIKYIASTDSVKIKEARNYIAFSIVAIAVMLSVWGLALFLKNSFFPTAPQPYDPETPLGDDASVFDGSGD
ncbi:pilin [Candidatus Parcubacteria bacterium]|nr:pilin [Candidatus Parcubacteria bacterium]